MKVQSEKNVQVSKKLLIYSLWINLQSFKDSEKVNKNVIVCFQNVKFECFMDFFLS